MTAPSTFHYWFFHVLLASRQARGTTCYLQFCCFNRPTVLLLRWDDKTGVVWLNKKLDKPVGSVFVLKVSFLYKANAWYTVTSQIESTAVFCM